MILIFFTGLLGFIAIYCFLLSEPVPLKGVYRQKGKYFRLKYILFRIVFWLRSRKNKNLSNLNTKSAGYGLRSRISPMEMDKIQILSQDFPEAVDAVYFNGGNKEGVYIVAATARRHNGITQTILIIRLPDIGLLEIPTQPDTNLNGVEGKFSAGGLTLDPVCTMKTWKLSYQGQLRLRENNKLVSVSFILDWNATTPYFDFDTDLNPTVMSGAIARELWSQEYFNNLKRAHQTHYEQFGEITGIVNIEGYDPVNVKIQGVRDHSYGNIREWRDLHRYGIQYMYFENGLSVCIGCICMPKTMSRLVIGYVFQPDGSLETVSHTDFELVNFGDDGKPPNTLELNFIAGITEYHLEISVIDCAVFYMGIDWDAKIFERFCKFKLNGVPGWGISEWEYRNKIGRNDLNKEESTTTE